MYGWMFLGFSTVLVFREVWRLFRRDGDRHPLADSYQASDRNSHIDPLGSHASNTNTTFSRNDSKDPVYKSDPVAAGSKKPLSPATYKDYFAPLRDAEDFQDEYHTRARTSVTPHIESNFMDLPIRPGVKDCRYYMRKGSCMYGANCKFNHPNPTAEDDSAFPSSGYANKSSNSK